MLSKRIQIILKCLILILLIIFLPTSILNYSNLTNNDNFLLKNIEALRAVNVTIDFSTFLGGADVDNGYSIALDQEGDFYVTGFTESNDFPTKNAFDSSLSGSMDAFAAKFTGDGVLLWSSYLGGSNRDRAFGISVTDCGECYIMGITNSSDFPVVNAYNETFSGTEDVFLTKISTDGLLLWSTYIGGNERETAADIAVISDGSCYLTGETYSANFPMKNSYENRFNGLIDTFVIKFSAEGSLLWSTYLGGEYADWSQSIAVSSDGSCYVTGITASIDFPTHDGFTDTPNGDLDGFVTRFASDGSLIWSTYLGGESWDESHGITVSDKGFFYVTGFTNSTNFPILDAFATEKGYAGDVFVTKFTTDCSLLWSTFLGGNGIERGFAVTTNSDGSCYVTGETFSNNFPTKKPFEDSLQGIYDAFISKFTSTGFLIWSTYLGGSRTDSGEDIIVTKDNRCFVVGITFSDDFPETQNAFDRFFGGATDMFITALIEPLTHQTIQSYYFYGLLTLMIIALVSVITLYRRKQ